MALAFYMDHHVPSAITNALRIRGVDVITAYEDNAHEFDDATLLDRAAALQRVVFTRDDDFLAEAAWRQQAGTPFHGVIYAHQLRVSISICVSHLDMIAKVGVPDDVLNAPSYTCLYNFPPYLLGIPGSRTGEQTHKSNACQQE